MPKNPNSKPKKRDEPMRSATKWLLAGCVAELYLLIVRRFYIRGTAVQQIAWHDQYLKYLIIAGAVILALGAVLSYLWRQDSRQRLIGWLVAAGGVFLAVSNGLVLWNMSTLTLLTIVVPVVALLGILWNLYDRECAAALSVLGFSLIAVWVCRRMAATVLYVKAAAVIYIVLLVVLILLVKQGKLGKLLPAKADPLPVYAACGLSIAALAAALIGTAMATYAMWALAIVIFGLAVYYTVKQL